MDTMKEFKITPITPIHFLAVRREKDWCRWCCSDFGIMVQENRRDSHARIDWYFQIFGFVFYFRVFPWLRTLPPIGLWGGCTYTIDR